MKKGVSVQDVWTHFCKAASPKDKPLKLAEVPLDWDEIKSTAPGNDINIPLKKNQTSFDCNNWFWYPSAEAQSVCVCRDVEWMRPRRGCQATCLYKTVVGSVPAAALWIGCVLLEWYPKRVSVLAASAKTLSRAEGLLHVLQTVSTCIPILLWFFLMTAWWSLICNAV